MALQSKRPYGIIQAGYPFISVCAGVPWGISLARLEELQEHSKENLCSASVTCLSQQYTAVITFTAWVIH